MTKRYNPSTNEYESVSAFYDFTESEEHNEFIKRIWADEDDNVEGYLNNLYCGSESDKKWHKKQG